MFMHACMQSRQPNKPAKHRLDRGRISSHLHDGARIGKGGGYSEIEYGILQELKLISDKNPIVTTVHDAQVVDAAPVEDHDFSVDIIITPTRVIRTNRERSQPEGIIWNKITPIMLENISILKELRRKIFAERN